MTFAIKQYAQMKFGGTHKNHPVFLCRKPKELVKINGKGGKSRHLLSKRLQCGGISAKLKRMQKQGGGSRLKAKKWIWLLPLIVALCLAAGLGIARLCRPEHTHRPGAALSEGVALTVGQREVTVAELSYYYWSEYYYYMNSGQTHLPESDKDLDKQAYDKSSSWYDFFLDAAIVTAREDLALCEAGRAAGFTLPEQWQAELDAVTARFSDYAAAGGFFLSENEPDVDGYLKSSYGAQANRETFFRHLEDVYYAAAYTDSLYYGASFSDEQVEHFFRLHEAGYKDQGLSWDGGNPVRAAWAEFIPQTTGKAGLNAAYERAETMALSWHAAGGGEEAFVALGEGLTFDTTETASDRWQAPVWLQPSQRTSGVIDEWCFDPLRQVGDYTITRTAEGWALIFFCQRAVRSEAYSRAEEELRYETYRSELKKIVENTEFSLTEEKIVIAEPLQDEK